LTHSASSILVAFDMTLLEGRVGGTGVYANALRRALAEQDNVEVEAISAPAGGAFNTIKWMISGARARVRRTGAAVLHCPAYLAPLDSPVPMILTIMDLSVGRWPSGHPFEWRMYFRILLPRLARKAKAILTPTEATRKDVIDAFELPPERVVVTPLGIDRRFFEVSQRDRSIESPLPVIVFPGPPIGRKNLDIILRALASAPSGSALSRARLEITGAIASDFPHYQDWISQNGLQGRVRWLGAVRYEDVPAIYAQADVLTYPSFMEGFGFPPLEAMAVGTPVVASSASCLPEVLGDAAVLIDPTDDAACAVAVESVLGDAELRRRLALLGTARARSFTWERCAAQTAAVYRRVAGSD
jgi:glycosyltransferase involved in cell wall biosynthesis